MVEHPPLLDLERFVSGQVPSWDGFEEHMSRCDACAGRLQREARVQLAAEGAARALTAEHSGWGAWRRPLYVMGVGMALAASLLFAFRAVTAAAAESADLPGNQDDVHGQPVALSAPDGGFEGTFLAVRDAGPNRLRPSAPW
jgi:hypothetical protein